MDGREKIKIKALKGAWWKQTAEIFTLVQNRKLIIPNTSRKISNLEYTMLRERERRKTLILIHVMSTYNWEIYIYKARSPNYHTCDLY